MNRDSVLKLCGGGRKGGALSWGVWRCRENRVNVREGAWVVIIDMVVEVIVEVRKLGKHAGGPSYLDGCCTGQGKAMDWTDVIRLPRYQER